MISDTHNKQVIISEHKTGLTPGGHTNMGLIQLIGPCLTLTGATIGKRQVHRFEFIQGVSISTLATLYHWHPALLRPTGFSDIAVCTVSSAGVIHLRLCVWPTLL